MLCTVLTMTSRRPVPDDTAAVAPMYPTVVSRPDGVRDKISRVAKALGLGDLRDDQITSILEDAAREHDRDAVRRPWGAQLSLPQPGGALYYLSARRAAASGPPINDGHSAPVGARRERRTGSLFALFELPADSQARLLRSMARRIGANARITAALAAAPASALPQAENGSAGLSSK